MTTAADSVVPESKMKKCPFCGAPGHVYTNDMSEYSDSMAVYYQPGCNTKDCLCYHGIDCNFDHIIEAVEAWNKRAGDASRN